MTVDTAPAWRSRIVRHADIAPSELTAHPLNFRRHPKAQADAVGGALAEVGWVADVIVNARTGRIVDGHLRVELAVSRGESTVPVAYVDLDDAEERLVLATLDPLASLAETDAEQLRALLAGVVTEDDALAGLLADLAASAGIEESGNPSGDPGAQIDRAEELRQKWGTERGQLWEVGRHRLLCGDSTSAEDVAALMGSVAPDMVFADPPYGISIVAANGYVGGGEAYDIPFGGRKGLGSVGGAKPFGSKDVRGSDGASNVVEVGKYLPVKGDDTTATALVSYRLLSDLYAKAAHIWWGGNYYANALPPSSCWVVWDKENTGNFADCELAWTNQPTAVRLFRHRWNGMLKDSERGQRRVHPTQKPVALAAWCFESYARPDGVVLDPFAGSGITLVAAEQTGRSAYAIEYEADYIGVILERLSGMGLTARRV